MYSKDPNFICDFWLAGVHTHVYFNKELKFGLFDCPKVYSIEEVKSLQIFRNLEFKKGFMVFIREYNRRKNLEVLLDDK